MPEVIRPNGEICRRAEDRLGPKTKLAYLLSRYYVGNKFTAAIVVQKKCAEKFGERGIDGLKLCEVCAILREVRKNGSKNKQSV